MLVAAARSVPRTLSGAVTGRSSAAAGLGAGFAATGCDRIGTATATRNLRTVGFILACLTGFTADVGVVAGVAEGWVKAGAMETSVDSALAAGAEATVEGG